MLHRGSLSEVLFSVAHHSDRVVHTLLSISTGPTKLCVCADTDWKESALPSSNVCLGPIAKAAFHRMARGKWSLGLQVCGEKLPPQE